MREVEFIHASDDVPHILRLAHEMGLVIRNDGPTSLPNSDVVGPGDLIQQTCGAFILFKPEWVYGKPVFSQITEGANSGKYFQHPSTNYCSLLAYFSGERIDGEHHRLGSGLLSRQVRWYRSSDYTSHDADPDVRRTFDRLGKLIDTGRQLHGGVHNYLVLEGAGHALETGNAIPPFDYIEWPSAPAGGAGGHI